MIITRFIIEVMGKPPEMVKKTLEQVAKFIEERHDVIKKDISDVERVEKSEIYSGFLEIEFEVKSFEELFLAVVDFGPTVVEIIEPTKITVEASELQGALSDLIAKLHKMSKQMQLIHAENIKLKRMLSTSDKK